MPEELLARLIEKYHRLQAAGRKPQPEDFREDAGEHYDEFVALIAQEELFDQAVEGSAAERLPRTFGEYTLVGVLGQGGLAIVYRAIQRSLSRAVALKVLLGGWAKDEDLIERFRRGARAAAQIEHENVVRIHDHGVFEGRPYIAMTLVDGPSLADLFRRLRETGPPPFRAEHHALLDERGVAGGGTDTAAFVRRLAGLLAGPAKALELYHRKDIVHRDVKPANLLLAPEGHLVLTDFDLVKRLDTSFRTQAGHAMGTPAYMSPEQWDPQVREVDGRADVYGLGIVFYEGITQTVPFGDPDLGKMMSKVLKGTLPDARELVSNLPLDAFRVLVKATEKRREDRYPSAAAFARDLDALAAEEPVAARPIPASRRLGRWAWRMRGRLAAALLLATAASAWWFLRPAVLHIDPWPGGEIFIDGKSHGEGPLQGLSVSSGEHLVVVRKDGFREFKRTLSLEPGSSQALNPPLRAIDPNARETRRAWEEKLGISLLVQGIEADRAPRGFEGPALLLRPRGKVRLCDLGETCAAELSDPIEGRVVFLDEHGTEISAKAVDATHRDFELEFPNGLRGRLVEGKKYRWGFELASGRKVLTQFEVVSELPDGVLESLRSRFPEEDQHLARLFEIALLQREGLDLAALRVALKLAEKGPKRAAFGLAWRSLEHLDLLDSSTAAAVYQGYVEAGD